MNESDGARHVLLGTSWVDNDVSLRVRDLVADVPVATSRFLPLLRPQGASLAFRVLSDAPAWCLGRSGGRSPSGGPYECVNRATSVNRKCTPCSVADANHASNLHHAHRRDGELPTDPSVAAHLAEPNLLYVAGFRDGSIKVGTSNAKRIRTRLAEQGAWQAIVTAEAVNGSVVRLVEDAVTEALGLPQSVSMVRKLHGFVHPIDDEVLIRRLEQATAGIHELIAGIEGMTPVRQVVGFEQRALWNRVVRYPADPTIGAHELLVVSMCGRAALIELPSGQHDDRMVLDLGRLSGYEVEWGRFGTPSLTIQGSLF